MAAKPPPVGAVGFAEFGDRHDANLGRMTRPYKTAIRTE